MISFEVLGAIGLFLLALLGGGVGWNQIKKHGAEKEKRRDAEQERDAALERERQSNAADLSDDQRDEFIDSL